MIVHLNNAWATDTYIAKSYYKISRDANKSISTKDDWVIEVPDYNTRLSALNAMSKMKWLFIKWKINKKRLSKENTVYVFKNKKEV